jgi:PAS domain S-box-containing protein
METNKVQSRIAEVRQLLLECETALKAENSAISRLSPDILARIDVAMSELDALRAAPPMKPGSGQPDAAGSNEVLTEDNNLLAVTLRSIADAVITIDTRGHIVLLNRAAETLIGCIQRQVVGKSFEEVVSLFDEKDHDKPCSNYRTLINEGDNHWKEHRAFLRSPGGKEQMVTIQGSRIGDQGNDLGTVLVLRDVSKSSFLEEEMLKIRKLESIGVLAGGIAHDFNNLLTGITTNLFMARMSVVGNNEVCSLISEAEKAAFKATTLTKQLLSFARGGPSIKEKASIKQLVQDTVGFCLSGSNVDYRLELPDDLYTIEIDKGQIDQVLNNLILNAAQSMPDGGTVTISAENTELTEATVSKALPLPPGRYVKVSIRDEGSGIPRDHLERIFDPYFSTRNEGSGLGLSTSYSIIKRHGGHVFVESTDGGGSTFTFLLPVPADDESRKKTGTSMEKGSGKVLIMDDDVIVRTVVETLLKKTGYSPVCVINGDQALKHYKDALSGGDPFTVTIMDLTIPGGMGGKETVKRLREIDKNARVIVFSGYSNDPIFSNFKEYGFDGVLSKPFSIEEFTRTISMVLKEHSVPA